MIFVFVFEGDLRVVVLALEIKGVASDASDGRNCRDPASRDSFRVDLAHHRIGQVYQRNFGVRRLLTHLIFFKLVFILSFRVIWMDLLRNLLRNLQPYHVFLFVGALSLYEFLFWRLSVFEVYTVELYFCSFLGLHSLSA